MMIRFESFHTGPKAKLTHYIPLQTCIFYPNKEHSAMKDYGQIHYTLLIKGEVDDIIVK